MRGAGHGRMEHGASGLCVRSMRANRTRRCDLSDHPHELASAIGQSRLTTSGKGALLPIMTIPYMPIPKEALYAQIQREWARYLEVTS
jgi:hypothetical protein